MLPRLVKIVKISWFIVLISLCKVECRRVKRVVGGTAVECDEQLRVASLRNATNGQHLCGATLVTREYAITAAHCVTRTGYMLQLDNFCGEPPKARVLEIISHELYDKYVVRYSRAHDIALLRVEPFNLLVLDEAILPTHYFGAGGECTVYGYGVKDVSTNELSENLLSASVRIISLDECSQLLGPYMVPDVNSGMMCAVGYGVDTCQGDSGGPLMCQGLLDGVSSHGLACTPGVPAVYTSIRAHLRWIRKGIQRQQNNTTNIK